LITGKEEYKKYKLGFFIDRDFDQSIGSVDPPIFETPCYSVENFYVSISVFKEILVNEFHLSQNDELFDKLTDLYEERQKEFHNAILLFNAWYSCLVDKKEKEKINTGVKLDEKLPNGFVHINLDKVTANYDLEKIKSFFPDAIQVDAKVLEDKMLFLKNLEMHKVFRGKYELDFLIRIIKDILNDSRNRRKYAASKISFSFGDGSALSHQQVMNIFEAYAETPQSLLDYLEATVKRNYPA
jgi:hypothetical protein